MEAALGHRQALAQLVEVGELLAGLLVPDAGADGDADHQVLALAPLAVAAHAVLAALGAEGALKAQVHQGVEVVVGDQMDAAAVATIAAVGAPLGDELFAPEADAAVATVTRLDADANLVNELHGGKGPGSWGGWS